MAANITSGLRTEQVLLERVTLAFEETISDLGIRNSKLAPELQIAKVAEDLVVRVAMHAFEDPAARIDRILDAESECVPTDWWQHLKAQHAPRWFVRKWPVKTRALRLSLRVGLSEIYPGISPTHNKAVLTRIVEKL